MTVLLSINLNFLCAQKGRLNETVLWSTRDICFGWEPRKKNQPRTLRQKKSVFRVTGLKISGRVGTHNFFNYFFFWEKI